MSKVEILWVCWQQLPLSLSVERFSKLWRTFTKRGWRANVRKGWALRYRFRMYSCENSNRAFVDFHLCMCQWFLYSTTMNHLWNAIHNIMLCIFQRKTNLISRKILYILINSQMIIDNAHRLHNKKQPIRRNGKRLYKRATIASIPF